MLLHGGKAEEISRNCMVCNSHSLRVHAQATRSSSYGPTFMQYVLQLFPLVSFVLFVSIRVYRMLDIVSPVTCYPISHHPLSLFFLCTAPSSSRVVWTGLLLLQETHTRTKSFLVKAREYIK